MGKAPPTQKLRLGEVVELHLGPGGMQPRTGDRCHVNDFLAEWWQVMDLPTDPPIDMTTKAWLGVVHEDGAALAELHCESTEEMMR